MVFNSKPRGDRGFVIAVGLAVITMVAVAGGVQWLLSTTPELTGNTGGEEEVAGYYPGGYSCNPSAIGPFSDGVNSSETEACKEAREEHRLKANDLIQQTRSADAADSMAGLGYKQTLLGIIGMGFGFLTFCAAVAAAVYARNAVAITREVGRDQMRAYVHADWAIIDGSPFDCIVIMQVSNTGQTPAAWINIHAVAHVFNARGVVPNVRPDTSAPGKTWGPLAGGNYGAFPLYCEEEAECIERVRVADGLLTVEIVGRVKYETIFGEIYESEFIFHQNNLEDREGIINGIACEPGRWPSRMYGAPERGMKAYNKIGQNPQKG